MRYNKIKKLISKGVTISNPFSVEIGSEVDIKNISSKGVRIHSGSRIFGTSTLISAGAQLGAEGPVTINNCRLGLNVELKGGYFENSVFMEGVSAGYGCHVRSGTILEEFSSIAHSVGLKQTILFPFVKLGSLINFCDCFMSGGTSSKNHSEVGSSYTHFNYTPNQDKATPSLIGDVPNGVMLNQKPIFLGGQGGLVGPCRIAYGTTIAAGSIHRKDQLKQNRLVFSKGAYVGNLKHSLGLYRSVRKQVMNNIIYIANLFALMYWYKHIRTLFIADYFDRIIIKSLSEMLKINIKQRVEKFKHFCFRLKESALIYKELAESNISDLLMQQKKELYMNRNALEDILSSFLEEVSSIKKVDERFVFSVADLIGIIDSGYLGVISKFEPNMIWRGTRWLNRIVDEVINNFLSLFPSIR